MTKSISAFALEKLKGGVRPNGEKTDKAYKESAGENLFVMVGLRGTKTFYFDYRTGGKRTKLKIGNFPAVSLVKARTVALNMKQKVQRGDSHASNVRYKNLSRSKIHASVDNNNRKISRP